MKRLALAGSILALALAGPAISQTAPRPLDRLDGAAANAETEMRGAEAALSRARIALGSVQAEAEALRRSLDQPTATISPSPAPRRGWVPSPLPTGKPGIPSSFDAQLGLQPSWGTGAIPGKSDYWGEFRMTCAPGDLAAVDPIAYPPGTPGQSHLHQFYGTLGIRADDTYESLRAPGRESTCGSGTLALNKSGYWVPALLYGTDRVLRPNYVSVYYKRFPKTDPRCSWNLDRAGQSEECVNMPQGLKMIAGRDMLNPGKATDRTPGTSLYCMKADTSNASAPSDNFDELFKAPECQGDTRLYLAFDFPACWDGRNLDSPDHRAHVAYESYGDWGYPRCPRTHPKRIPYLHIAAEYTLLAGDDRALLRFSSDMFPQLPRGKSFHGDAFIAWDPVAWQAFHDNCIDRRLNCSGSDLGNGWQMKLPVLPTPGLDRIVSVGASAGDHGHSAGGHPG